MTNSSKQVNLRMSLEKDVPNCVLLGRTQGKILVVVHDLSYTCRVSHLNADLMEEDNVEVNTKHIHLILHLTLPSIISKEGFLAIIASLVVMEEDS